MNLQLVEDRPQTVREYKPYEVTLQITQTVSFTVDARTPEQAEDLAEAMAESGEEGQVESIDMDVLEVFPVDDDATGFV